MSLKYILNSRFIITDDIIEEPYYYKNIDIIKNPKYFFLFMGVLKSIRQLNIPKDNRLIWFGNHGSNNVTGGMTDLNNIYEYICNLRKEKISITIISNSKEKYNEITKHWEIPSFYLDWNKYFFSYILMNHGTSLIPITMNPFTLAKSSNRVTTSLAHSLKVIADPLQSYIDYNKYIYLGNWEESLSQIITEKNNYNKKLFNTEAINIHNKKIISKWCSVLL